MSALVTTEPKSDLGNELETLRLRVLELHDETVNLPADDTLQLSVIVLQTLTLFEELLHHLIIKEIL